MMDITNILQHLFKEQSLEDVSLASVQELAERYPYFAAAHFLLAKKMMQEHDGGFDDQLQKTNLYFHNTLWLHHILENSGSEPVIIPDLTISGAEENDATVLTTADLSEPITEPDALVMDTTGPAATEEAAIIEWSEERPVTVEPSYSTDDNGAIENNGIDTKEEIYLPQEPEPNGQATAENSIHDNIFSDETESAPEEVYAYREPEDRQVNDITEDNQYADSITEPIDSPFQGSEGSSATIVRLQEEADAPLEPDLSLPEENEQVDLSSVKEQETINSRRPLPAEDATEHQSSPLTMPEKAPASRTVFPKEELAFDPYHTIDYFASLGIRLSQEPKPDDKLGQQLKSFTAWLRTMRRLPEASQPEPVEVNQADLNAHIEKIAAHSLIDREVITQAMAEVLVLQGNREKAEEIYHKLSLLNPDKSAYFAAKIEELKRH